ncbi:hypothetical protein FDR95_07010 [Rhizobiaceae bacterium LC148]|nr:hypothetical protein FDR95_07010 [Rhizobiaceae bacterium LC148]
MPAISPTRGEKICGTGFARLNPLPWLVAIASVPDGRRMQRLGLSPLVGEMAGRPEGVYNSARHLLRQEERP